jgi:protein-S-isoprenylcysteine O-methyltransferase Ste14
MSLRARAYGVIGAGLVLLLALGAVLGGKARREERQLLAIHPGYSAYRATTAAIVPGLPWLDWRR